MTEFLLKHFVKDYKNVSNRKVRAAYGTLSGAVGVALNSLLCIFKFVIGIISSSAAVISDAANNLSDVSSSVVSILACKLAKKPADEKHPFGHGRYEYILSLIISFVVMLMGAELLKNGINKIVSPQPMKYSPVFILILIISIIIKLWLGIFNSSLAKRADFQALKAVAVDSFSDVISTFAVLVSFLLSHFLNINIDGYIGTIVSLLVIYSGINILKDSINPLLGKPADKDKADKISEFILGFDEKIIGVHDLILHDYGMGRIFAVAHAEVPADCDLMSIHSVIDSAEKQAGEEFGINLVLHIDPVDLLNKRQTHLKSQVETVVKSIDEHYTIHDFRLTEDNKMYFDLIIDSDINADAQKINRIVKARINSALGNDIEPFINCEFSFKER